jgi:reverse gyrase
MAITEEEARRRAEEELQRLFVDAATLLHVFDRPSLTRPYGWVFSWQSERYLETRDFMDVVVANSPLLVLRSSGKVIALPTCRTAEDSLARYEQGWEAIEDGAVPPPFPLTRRWFRWRFRYPEIFWRG